MERKTLSAVLESAGKIALWDFPRPTIKEDDALLEVEMVGICGSDVGMYTGKNKRIQPYLPIIMGHEIVGRIAEAGELFCRRHEVRNGDRVLVEFTFGCGFCRSCLTGNYRLCEKKGRYGSYISCRTPPHLWGGYGHHLYLPATAMTHKIDTSLPAEAAVVVSAVLGNAVRWLAQVGSLSIGDTIVIEGPGPQGLAAVVVAKEAGASRIIITGLSRDAQRLEMARQLGATHIIDVTGEDPVERVREITRGAMADAVIDLTGTPQAAIGALDLVRQGGTFIMPGTYGTDTQVPLYLDKIVLKEIRVLGVYSHDMKSVIPAIGIAESRKYPLEKLVTHRYSLQEAERAVRAVAGLIPGELPIKAVIDPHLRQ
jgi:alcohol dehydrogenase